MEQTLQALAALVQMYQGIDYSSPYATKTHAHIAVGYLADAVRAEVPHEMADVLMEGVRVMGRSAQNFVVMGVPDETATLIQKISSTACAGCVKESYYPVTMEGMTQLAILAFDVIRSYGHNNLYALSELRRNVAQISELFLKVPDASVSNIHNTYLGPYYSSTSQESLRYRLTALVNHLCQQQDDDEGAQTVARNIQQWADGIYLPTKEFLLAAIAARSHFTITIIQWIAGVTELLLVLSNAPACDPHTQAKLRNDALWLIATLTWVPDDKDSVTFVEKFQLTETLFKAATNARNRDFEEVSREIGNHLLSWSFKGGRYITGWRVLERGLCACAAIALKGDDRDVDVLKSRIRKRLQDDHAPEKEVLERAGRKIRDRANSSRNNGHW